MIKARAEPDVENSTAPTDWSEPERRLWEAYRRGVTSGVTTASSAARSSSGCCCTARGSSGHIARLRLRGARITGQVDLSEARLTNPDGTALTLVEAQATRLIPCLHPGSAGTVNLQDARVGRFVGDPHAGPGGAGSIWVGSTTNSQPPDQRHRPCPCLRASDGLLG